MLNSVITNSGSSCSCHRSLCEDSVGKEEWGGGGEGGQGGGGGGGGGGFTQKGENNKNTKL